MEHADVFLALCEVGRMEDSLGNGDSNTMERLKKGQVKLGAVTQEHYAGSQRRIFNQTRTVNACFYKLLNLLTCMYPKSEHVWVCPVCKDDNFSTDN
jgi:hypothetical protein